MNAARLLEHYERIADAPDAVGRLRRFILDLAVRGKLVPQDLNDEPASELLKRIAAEKARLVKTGQVTRSGVDPLSRDEIPYALPVGWGWSRIGEICSKTGSGSTPRGGQSVYKKQGIPFLRSQNVYDDGLRLEDVAYIDRDTHARMSGTAIQPRDLLLNITGGSIGRCCRVPGQFGEANVSQHVAIIRSAISGIEYFLHRLILSPYFQGFIFGEQTGAGRGGLPKNRMDRIPVALPPFAEQHRIVAKVDELMELCDGLEAARAGREATRNRLTTATFARFNAHNPATLQHDARFALDALPVLTTRPDQIKQLRQTILNLAVCGRLVAQEPRDEAALELLKRIAVEKARLMKAGEIKQEKPLPELHADELPFEVPRQWQWVRLECIAHKITDGEHLSPIKTTSGMPLLTAVHVTTKGLALNDPQFVSMEDGYRFRLRCDPRRGDILICSRGTIGRCAVVDVEAIFCLMGSVILLRFPPECVPSFFNIFLSTDRAQLQMGGMSGATAVQALYLKDIRLCPIPIPPLAEQHRIVAKVDELMALCDQLETSLATGDDTRRRLLDALLQEALTLEVGPVAGRSRRVATHA